MMDEERTLSTAAKSGNSAAIFSALVSLSKLPDWTIRLVWVAMSLASDEARFLMEHVVVEEGRDIRLVSGPGHDRQCAARVHGTRCDCQAN